jgi:hypothetical protein
MDKINNPHDNFFSKTWSDPMVARDFLANYLPEKNCKAYLSEPAQDSIGFL